MGLKDISGVFSRYFIVGFFLPAFFGLIALATMVTHHLYPSGYHPRTEGGILVLGGTALLGGLLLLGLNYPIVRLFEGYFLESTNGLRPLGRLLVRIQQRSFDRLAAEKELATKKDASDEEIYRGAVAWRKLDWAFPFKRGRVLPTRFGNAVRASEDYAFSRWRLDAIAIWPKIEPLLSEQERELHSNAKTDVVFFLNSTVTSIAVGLTLIVDAIGNAPLSAAYAWLYALPFLVAYVFYRFSIGAAERWGTETRASIDLHRLELYERLGIRRPLSFNDEREHVARPLNRFSLFGEELPDDLWRVAPPVEADGRAVAVSARKEVNAHEPERRRERSAGTADRDTKQA
jgi:hypothetical protein